MMIVRLSGHPLVRNSLRETRESVGGRARRHRDTTSSLERGEGGGVGGANGDMGSGSAREHGQGDTEGSQGDKGNRSAQEIPAG